MKAIRLMWWTAYLGACVLVFDFIVGLLMTFALVGGRARHDELAGEFILMASAVVAIFGFLLFRAMRSVRWLDPNSTPAEWERKMAVARPRRR